MQIPMECLWFSVWKEFTLLVSIHINDCGRPWPAVCINFVLKIHQIQVLTEPLCRAQASFYALPNNEQISWVNLQREAELSVNL